MFSLIAWVNISSIANRILRQMFSRTQRNLILKSYPKQFRSYILFVVCKKKLIIISFKSGFGDYTESGVVIPVTYQGRKGGFVQSMFLDCAAPISGGREVRKFEIIELIHILIFSLSHQVWGFPKVKILSFRLRFFQRHSLF